MLEPPKAYSKDNLRKKMPTEMWRQNLRFYQNSKSFLIILVQFLSLTNLYACNSRLGIRKSITEKLFFCVLKINFKTV